MCLLNYLSYFYTIYLKFNPMKHIIILFAFYVALAVLPKKKKRLTVKA